MVCKDTWTGNPPCSDLIKWNKAKNVDVCMQQSVKETCMASCMICGKEFPRPFIQLFKPDIKCNNDYMRSFAEGQHRMTVILRDFKKVLWG